MLQGTASTLVKYFLLLFSFRFLSSLTCLTSIAYLIVVTDLTNFVPWYDCHIWHWVFLQSKVKVWKSEWISTYCYEGKEIVEFLQISITICLSISIGKLCSSFRRWFIFTRKKEYLRFLSGDTFIFLIFRNPFFYQPVDQQKPLCMTQTNKFHHQALLLKCNL